MEEEDRSQRIVSKNEKLSIVTFDTSETKEER